MKKQGLALLLAALLLLLTACGSSPRSALSSEELTLIEDSEALQTVKAPTEPETISLPVIEDDPADQDEEPPEETSAETSAEDPIETALPEEPPVETISEDGEYTSPEDVAAYIHEFGHLPSNFITKSEARDLGWDNSRGNLWDVAPGKSIGGDRFGNYEGLLPDDTKYKECDVNYTGGYRGAERLIYGENGSVYYTNDHYSSFTQLY